MRRHQSNSCAPSHTQVSLEDRWLALIASKLRTSRPLDNSIESCWGCVLQAASQWCIVVITLAIVGQLGYQEMAAAAVSTTYCNLMIAFLVGMASGFDTLASQAYGAGDHRSIRVWAVTATAVLAVAAAIFSGCLWLGEDAARAIFRQGPEIAAIVGVFCRWLIPGILPFALSLILVKVIASMTMRLAGKIT